jgi:formylglycine-generating enzyme required for sulfatase activity
MLGAAAIAAAGLAGGCATASPRVMDDPLRPRDLTPVTWRKATRHPPVDIVREGKAEAVVYVADARLRKLLDPPKRKNERPTTFSQLLGQLGESVRLATGADLPVVTNAPAADQPAIVIGDCAEARAAGIDAATIPAEGFVIRTAPNRVYLVGSTVRGEGAAWAIADFLERFVGARWYWPTSYGGRSIPPRASLVIPPVHYADQPVFPYRTMYQDWYWLQARSGDDEILSMAPGAGAEGAETLWLGDFFRLMRHGNSWPYEPVQQGARIFEFMNNTLRTNTAIFAVRDDGSRNTDTFCYSSPALLACYLDNLERAWDKGGKNVTIGGITRSCVTLWPCMDIGNNSLVSACRCQPCQHMAARGGDALIMGDFVRRLCEEVKRRWPDKKVIYVPWNILKCPEKMTFPDNLVVNSLDLGAMGLLCQPTIRREQEGLLHMWAAKTGRPASMWVDFAGPGDWTYGPVQFPHLVQEFYQTNTRRLAGGQILSYATPCFVTAAPTCYVWNRALWNPNMDVDAVLDEMCRRLFGAGAADARELLRLQCDRWEKTPLSRPMRVGEQRVAPKLFREIWPADVVARMKVLRDDALAAIERSGDNDARRAFLYWTWTFDAFAAFADKINAGVTPQAAAGDDGGKPPMAAPSASAATPTAEPNPDAAARFQGGATATNIIRIANARRTDAADGRSELRFDLAWGNTWRAKWIEPAASNVTGRDQPVESWSAAWVFAKYRLPGQEKEGYYPATLAPDRAQHKVPGGATLDVGLTGGRGTGVFIYRAVPGHGPLDLRDISLCWLHGADGVTNPAAADIKVFAIEMVYVPKGSFQLGSGGTEDGSFTDGSWTDGAAIPFLVDANWSGPLAAGSNARRIGAAPGRLWGVSDYGRNSIGPEGAVLNRFPTGYEAFYCMRYEVTREQFTAFLNTISAATFQATSAGDKTHAGSIFTAVGRYGLQGLWPHFTAAKPYQACNLLSWWDAAQYAAWAGLRPMTELEYEKACRGPRKPAANEFAWGTTGIVREEYAMEHEGKDDERVTGGVSDVVGNANYDLTMPAYFGWPGRSGVGAIPGSPVRAGIFATPTGGRAAAGASCWGILELSGNVREQVVTIGNAQGRMFEGTHGNGTLDIPADWPRISGSDSAVGTGLRGGFYGDLTEPLRTSDRSRAVFSHREATFSHEQRSEANGWRGVRTAPEADAARPGADAASATNGTSLAWVQTNRQMPRLSPAIRADGVLNEWTNKPALIRRELSRIFPEDRRHPQGKNIFWQGPNDFSVKAWWGWDGSAICLAAEVTDDRHFNTQTGGTIWNGDALQLEMTLGTNAIWNLGLALTTNGVVFHPYAGTNDALSKTAACAVARDDGARITRYELRLPLADLGLKPDDGFGFNVVFLDDDDGNGSRYWFELAPGLCGRKAKSPPPWQTYPQFELGR